MSTGRASGCHYCPPWVTGLWLSLGILALLFTVGCRQRVAEIERPMPPAIHKSRIELPREGDALLKRPVRAARPRGPAYRLDNGLGSPIT